MINLDSILKSRDTTLATNICVVKAMVFPIVMYGCESWNTKKAESWRIDAFELWCWRRLLRVPWTAKRSNQSILKEISPDYSLEGLMLKLKLQYFGHLTDSLKKTLEIPLGCKKIQPVHPKGNQSWIFIGRSNVEAEAPMLWPPNAKNWQIWKHPDARKDWRWEEKGTTEDEMVGWHHWLSGHEFEQALGVGDAR